MANILAIGIATLDIINIVDAYPAEDSETRTVSQRQSRGGNATNTLTILSQLHHNCHWAGVLIDEPDVNYIASDLANHQINTSHCKQLTSGKMPTSYITVNQQTGSRTIVHHRDCPEYSFEDFKTIDLSQFDWLHFEGRNIADTGLMLQHVATHHPSLPCSLEVEKPRQGIGSLFELPTVLMFSHHYAESYGFNDAVSLLMSLPNNITATCTWGQQGAWAITPDSSLIHSDAFSPSQVVDTLSAGDTFNAGLIHSLIQHNDLKQALSYACQLAGHKCGQHGLANLLTHFKVHYP